MKSTLSLYLRLLWPICLVDFLLTLILPLLFSSLQEHLVLLNILVFVPLVLILSYSGGLKTGRVSTGIFATFIYAFIWRYIFSVLMANLMGIDYYAIDASQLNYLFFGVLVIFFIGAPVVSLLSWPAAYLGCKKAIKKIEALPLNQKESQKPWISIIILFYIRTIAILFVLYTLYNVWGHEAFRCSFAAWDLPSCSYKPGYGAFLVYSFILLFFNAVLIFVDAILGRRSLFSKKLLALDFALALPSWVLTGLTQAIICSLPFVVKVVMWLINGRCKN